jgi:hypothetical protein
MLDLGDRGRTRHRLRIEPLNMDFCEAFVWIERTPIAEALRNSRVLFPIVEIIHLIGLALFAGPLFLIDLGLLGLAMRRQPVAEFARALLPWTRCGIALLLVTGPMMFAAQATKWYGNPVFWFKMALLTLALAFQWRAHRKVMSENALRPLPAKLIGSVSLLLWISTAISAKIMESF